MDTNKEIWPKSYSPAPDIPAWWTSGLAAKLGRNRFNQPNYRVEWGMDARGFLNGDPNAILYQNPNDPDLGWACWMFQRWAEPSFFDKPEWEQHRYGVNVTGEAGFIDYLGPFPSRGDYIMIAPLITEDYGFIPLSQQLLDELVSRVEYGSQSNTVLGQLEISRRLKAIKNAEIVEQQLEERKQYYRTNAERIDAEHSRKYVGLLKSLPSAPLLDPEVTRYRDSTGATHTLWEDKQGGHARIDFTVPATTT